MECIDLGIVWRSISSKGIKYLQGVWPPRSAMRFLQILKLRNASIWILVRHWLRSMPSLQSWWLVLMRPTHYLFQELVGIEPWKELREFKVLASGKKSPSNVHNSCQWGRRSFTLPNYLWWKTCEKLAKRLSSYNWIVLGFHWITLANLWKLLSLHPFGFNPLYE